MKFFFLLLSCLLSSSLFATDPVPPRLMLATVYEPGIDVSEYWISEKLDGVRGHWTGERLLTRGGHVIFAPEWFTAGWPALAMDGELWIARSRFEEVSGIVRTQKPDDATWRAVRFMVFDLPRGDDAFEARVMQMRALLGDLAIPWLRPVEQFRVENADALDEVFQEIVAAGGEGLMLHHRDARYRAGRSDHLLKYKPHDDDEARVIGYTAGEGKYAGMLGALIVERPDGLRFRIGSGFTDAERAEPPAIGSLVTYRYNGLTSNGVPRFARFLRVRHEMP
ncbi:MAG TPA: DNA ligase, partial [Gammaproteobacteria bacterium]